MSAPQSLQAILWEAPRIKRSLTETELQAELATRQIAVYGSGCETHTEHIDVTLNQQGHMQHSDGSHTNSAC